MPKNAFLDEAPPLRLRSEEIGPDTLAGTFVLFQLLVGKRVQLGISNVLGDPVRHIVQVAMDEVVPATTRLPVQNNVFIDGTIFVATETMPEEAQHPGRIPPAVANPLTIEDEAAIDIEPVQPVSVVGEDICNFTLQLSRQVFIGVEDQKPFITNRQCVQCPISLGSVPEPGLLYDGGAHFASDPDGLIGAEAVDDKDLVGPPTNAIERLADVDFFVSGNDEDGKRNGLRVTPVTRRSGYVSRPGFRAR